MTLTTTANDLVHYLVERGLLTPASIVDGHLTVVPTLRRNNNFSVVCTGGPSYFVKSLVPGTAQAPETLRQEATLYSIAAADDALGELRTLLPAFHLYDPQRNLLVVEHLDGAQTLSEVHAQLGGAAEWIGEQTGRALAIVHRAGATALPRIAESFKRQPPWALSLHQITPSFGQSGVQLQTLLLTYPEYTQALDAMRAGWRINTVIHGDMKFDNTLVLDKDGERTLKIIDWELADAGEDLWDVAGIVQNYLFWSALTQIPFETLQPAMRALWNAYCGELGTSDEDNAPRLQRCVSYAAARLLQSVMEMLVVSPVMSQHVAVLLQTSLNILRDPAAMASMIIPTDARAAHV